MNTSLSPARANKIAADLARKRDALLEEIENVPAPVAPDAPPSARENTALAEAIQRDAQEEGARTKRALPARSPSARPHTTRR